MSDWGQCVTHHICDCKQAELDKLRNRVNLTAIGLHLLAGPHWDDFNNEDRREAVARHAKNLGEAVK